MRGRVRGECSVRVRRSGGAVKERREIVVKVDRKQWGKRAICRDGKFCGIGFIGLAVGVPLMTLEYYPSSAEELIQDATDLSSSELKSLADANDLGGFESMVEELQYRGFTVEVTP